MAEKSSHTRNKRTEELPAQDIAVDEAIDIVASQLAEILWEQYLSSRQDKNTNDKTHAEN